MNEKLTEREYSVRLSRPNTGSGITIKVNAVSPAQAQRKAQDELPGWHAQNAQ